MPKIVGKGVTVVEFEGLKIEELAGNVASSDDTLSVAKVTVSKATAEPWLTLDYDEWLCCLSGTISLHYGSGEVLVVHAGETCFIARGERFRPVFPGPATYIPVCLPAFKPERCLREEDGVSEVTTKLMELHGAGDKEAGSEDILYHMCQKSLWDAAVSSGCAYFPPTFEADGGFTHATAVPARLVSTANHFYTKTLGEWICLELSQSALTRLGIVTRLEEPKAVGETQTDNEWNEWRCPHIFGGIPAQCAGVLRKTYPMKRNADGTFENIVGLTD